MRRQNSTKSASGLSRTRSTKSTASFRSAIQRLEHIDPEIAERDAHLAATLSFCRAGQTTDPQLVPRNSTAQMENWPRDPAGHGPCLSQNSADTYDENGLHRQRSVRFVKEASRSKRPQSQLSDTDTICHRSVLGRIENLPAGQNSTQPGTPYVSPFTASYIESLPPVGSYRPADEGAPAPSSFRKLRKSRSMFTSPNQALPSRYFFNNSPEQTTQKPALRRKSLQNITENEPSPKKDQGLRAPKSTSFLKVSGIGSASKRQQNDLAVQVAEDNFRRDLEEQKRLKAHGSSFFSKRKQSQSTVALRKSMRDFSDDSQFNHSILSLPLRQNGSFRKKARKVSNSLKSKLKTLFRRNKKDEMPIDPAESVPVDTVESQAGDAEQDDPYMEIVDPIVDECSVSQVPSRVPSLHTASSAQRLRSRQGSIESISSDRKASDGKSLDDKSRVTSWTSSGTNTLNSQSTWGGERERQRLSVIKENGPHISSASFRRPAAGEHNPYEFETLSPQQPSEPTRSGPAIDSQRVYSALINRLNEAKQKEQQLKNQHDAEEGVWGYHEATKSRKSFDERGCNVVARRSPPTIRCVLPEDDVFRDTPTEHAPSTSLGADMADSVKNESTSSSGSVVHNHQRPCSDTTTMSYKPYPGPCASNVKGISPYKKSITSDEEGAAVSKTLPTRSSAFFGSPTCHLFRTTSPYRRALHESMKMDSETSEIRSPTISELVSDLNLDIIPARRRPSLSQDDARVVYSDSIYSDQPWSKTSSTPPLNLGETTKAGFSSRHPSHGSTDRSARQAYTESLYSDTAAERDTETNSFAGVRNGHAFSHNALIDEPLTFMPTRRADRTVSDASSVEWKTWLSAKAAKDDVSTTVAGKGRSTAEVRNARPNMPRTSGHVREGAQIEDLESPVSCQPTGSENSKFRTPLRTTSHNSRQALSASRIEMGLESSKYSTSSRDENAVPFSEGRVPSRLRGMYGPPPIPPRSSLRTTPSLPLLPTHHSQSNIPVRSADRPASKMRSLDTMPEIKPLGISSRTRNGSPVKLVRRVGLRKDMTTSSRSNEIVRLDSSSPRLFL